MLRNIGLKCEMSNTRSKLVNLVKARMVKPFLLYQP